MNFYIPTKIHVQRDCVANYVTELASFGTKALIVTGPNSSKQNGSLKDVTEALSSQGVSYIIFDSIEQNPSLENVVQAAEVGKREHVTYIIGIGGGSPMDAAKAVAVLVANPGEKPAALYEKKSLRALPVVEVPTTAGTGAEVTPNAVLTLHEEKIKKSMTHKVYPSLALVDPKYLNFSNKELLVNTAIDALAHLIESYLNTNANPFNRMLSEYGLDLWGSVKEVLLIEDDPTEEEAETLALASTIGGMAIAHTGTSLPHGMSYYLTYEQGIPHGNAVGIFLPAFIDLYEDRSQVKTVLRLLEFRNEKAFFKFIDSLFDIVTLDQEELDRYVDSMLTNEKKLANYPFPMTRETMELLFLNSVSVEKKKLFTFFKKNKKNAEEDRTEAVVETRAQTEAETLEKLRKEQERAQQQVEYKKQQEREKALREEKAAKEKAYQEAREKALMAREKAAKEAAEAKKQTSAVIEEETKTTVLPNILGNKKKTKAGRSLFATEAPEKKEVEEILPAKKEVVKEPKEPIDIQRIVEPVVKKVEVAPRRVAQPEKRSLFHPEASAPVTSKKVEQTKEMPQEKKTVAVEQGKQTPKPEIKQDPLASIKRAQAAAEAERQAREEVERAAQMAAEEAKKAEEAAKEAARARAAAAARAEELQRRIAEAEARAAEAKKAIDSID